MSFNQYHPLPPDPPKEKYVLGLSLPELFWTLLGIVFSYKLMKTIPPLPIDNFVFSRIHFLIPLLITSIFAFGKHPKTGLSITVELINLVKFRFQDKVLLYKRGKY